MCVFVCDTYVQTLTHLQFQTCAILKIKNNLEYTFFILDIPFYSHNS